MSCVCGLKAIPVICLIEKDFKNCLKCPEIEAGPLSAIIELGVYSGGFYFFNTKIESIKSETILMG